MYMIIYLPRRRAKVRGPPAEGHRVLRLRQRAALSAPLEQMHYSLFDVNKYVCVYIYIYTHV